MDKHVLVMALSAYAQPANNGSITVRKTEYTFEDRFTENNEAFQYTGYLQQEVIPVFIKEYLKETITDVILLTTAAVENDSKKFKFADNREFEGTVYAYNVSFLKNLFPDCTVHEPIQYNEHKLGTDMPFKNVMEKLYELHGQVANESEWKLWFDTHGGFRDISLALISASRLLALSMYENQYIATTAIYSVLHFWEPNQKDLIVDQTAFYFAESTEALKSYLNYGQFLNTKFVAENTPPYAFISYSHRSNNEQYLLYIRMIFQNLQDKGIRFWFDDGIQTGDNWVKKLEQTNENSAVFIGILTDEYFKSTECWKELLRSISLNKPAHFFLIGNVSILTTIPSNLNEALSLQKELGVTDEQIQQYLSPETQRYNTARVLPVNKQAFINECTPNDTNFIKEFDIIKKLIGESCS